MRRLFQVEGGPAMCGGSAFLDSSVRWESGKTVAFQKGLTDANVSFREMAELECIKIRDNAFKDCHAEVKTWEHFG